MKNQAFTLIELLVVVLIIGILAAIAVPQYQKSVGKSRAISIIPIVQSLVNAEEAFYLANGYYTSNIDDLDISLPSVCQRKEGYTSVWACGEDFRIVVKTAGSVTASYCPGHNDSVECITKSYRDFAIRIAFSNPDTTENYDSTKEGYRPKERLCIGKTDFGNKVCEGLTI